MRLNQIQSHFKVLSRTPYKITLFARAESVRIWLIGENPQKIPNSHQYSHLWPRNSPGLFLCPEIGKAVRAQNSERICCSHAANDENNRNRVTIGFSLLSVAGDAVNSPISRVPKKEEKNHHNKRSSNVERKGDPFLLGKRMET